MNVPVTDCSPCVLLVDDEDHILFSSVTLLRRASIRNVKALSDSREVLPFLAGESVGAIVLDLFMPHISGKDLLVKLCRDYPHIPVIVMTAAHDLETAVECMKLGAFDYLLKPVENARFISSITKALQIFTLKNQMAHLEQQLFTGRLEHPDAFSSMVGVSRKMQTVFQYCEVIGSSREPVLITGETGTGKELLARSIHAVSRVGGKFVAVNVAGLDDNLFTDTLFGHRKGAYTGADEARNGLIESAADGTLFLDEIGDLSKGSQVKLLRLLQEQEYYPVGSDIPKKSTARVIASTNKDVCEAVKRGRFRNDLYYRICAHRVLIPPLRERSEDIALLVEHFLQTAAQKLGKQRPSPAPQLIPFLCTYSFPGNIRELEAMVFDAVARHRSGVLSLASFKEVISRERGASSVVVPEHGEQNFLSLQCGGGFPTLKESETFLVNEALQRSNGNQGIAASLLGISRSALNKRLQKKS